MLKYICPFYCKQCDTLVPTCSHNSPHYWNNCKDHAGLHCFMGISDKMSREHGDSCIPLFDSSNVFTYTKSRGKIKI